MTMIRIWCKVGTICLAFITVSANAALYGRLPLTPGGTDFQAYYEDELKTLWTADANLPASKTFGVLDIISGGRMHWSTAQTWIAAMNSDGGTGYLGISNWRLPHMKKLLGDEDIPSVNCSAVAVDEDRCKDNEYGYLYYYDGVTNDGGTSAGPFDHLSNGYWSSTVARLDASKAWQFRFNGGGQNALEKEGYNIHAWAVRDGDVRLPVSIDVLQGCINTDARGVIPVAILGAEDFDVTWVNQSSLSFSGFPVGMLGNGSPQCSHKYVNADSYLDLVCQFRSVADAWEPDNGTATLLGSLLDGQAVPQPIEGSDSICIVP